MPERKTLNRTYSVGDQVPTCPVFTRAKIKSRFGIIDNLPSHKIVPSPHSMANLLTISHTLVAISYQLKVISTYASERHELFSDEIKGDIFTLEKSIKPFISPAMEESLCHLITHKG